MKEFSVTTTPFTIEKVKEWSCQTIQTFTVCECNGDNVYDAEEYWSLDSAEKDAKAFTSANQYPIYLAIDIDGTGSYYPVAIVVNGISTTCQEYIKRFLDFEMSLINEPVDIF